MLIDTSALVAIRNGEHGSEHLLRLISEGERRWLSVASYVEFGMVTKDLRWINGFIRSLDIELVELSKHDAQEALNGFFRYGKGTGHPAGLNFGDCLVYGTAKANGMHLLFKGKDFSQTDLVAVLAEGEEQI